MARGVQHVQFAATERNPIVVVVLKIFAAEIAFARAVNAELGAAAFAQRQRAAAMIAVDMGEENLFDLLRAHGFGLFDDAVHI